MLRVLLEGIHRVDQKQPFWGIGYHLGIAIPLEEERDPGAGRTKTAAAMIDVLLKNPIYAGFADHLHTWR